MTSDDGVAKQWHSLAGLLSAGLEAPTALLGAPMAGGAVTPGECDRAPAVFRTALKRISTYDVETGQELCGQGVYDAGDVGLKRMSPEESFAPITSAFSALVAKYDLSILIGGNNAITRPGVHSVDSSLQNVGLITLDAHFDLRDTSAGLLNGNPVQALLDDGLPGAHIAQIGIAPFANAAYMHETAKAEGINVYTIGECRQRGVEAVLADAFEKIAARCDRIYVDFDIDVIERGLAPGAPGARPGGMTTTDFFAATRAVGAQSKVCAVDLTEFDPACDVSDITSLVAGRWFGELLAGFQTRGS